MKKIIINAFYKLYAINNSRIRTILIKIIARLDGGMMWSTIVRNIYNEYYGIDIGIGTYGGCFDTLKIPRGTKFGKYCSIAPTIYIFNANHPKEFITTHPIAYNPVLGVVKKERVKRRKLTVGNDVWIGQNAIITNNVSYIGDGAIIGAGSVVTKNIEPYEIVAGVPAKKINKRFDDITISKIRESKWWDLDPNYIKKNIHLFEDVDKIELITNNSKISK